MAKIIKRSDFANLAGIKPDGVTYHCKRKLAAACVGKRIDVDHPAAIEFLKGHGVTMTESNLKDFIAPEEIELASLAVKKKKKVPEFEEDIQFYLGYTLGELIEKFGTATMFLDWLKATQTIEVINEKRLKNAAIEGKLINREMVKTRILEPINTVHLQILSDGSKTLAKRVPALHDAGHTSEQIEKYIEGIITKFLKPMRAKIKRALKSVQVK